MRQKNLKSQFFQNHQHVFQTVKVNLCHSTPFSKSCDDFLGGFWVARIVKLKETPKIFATMTKKT